MTDFEGQKIRGQMSEYEANKKLIAEAIFAKIDNGERNRVSRRDLMVETNFNPTHISNVLDELIFDKKIQRKIEMSEIYYERKK